MFRRLAQRVSRRASVAPSLQFTRKGVCRFSTKQWNLEDYVLPAQLTDQMLTPALVVYMDKVRSNARMMIDTHLDGDARRWRPHAKTVKIPEIYMELMKQGVSQFKVATTRELQVLLVAMSIVQRNNPLINDGEKFDIVVAYPHMNPALGRIAELAEESKAIANVSVCVEDLEVLTTIPAILDVYLDVNVGMNRTGVPIADTSKIAELARAASTQLDWTQHFRGLHVYEGHLHTADLVERRKECFAVYDQVMDLMDLTNSEHLITSGTPAVLSALAYPGFKALSSDKFQVSPGTVVYHDGRSQQENVDLNLQPAALVVSRVVSVPAPGMVTLDAGSKSLAAEVSAPIAEVLHDGQSTTPEITVLTPSEEHLPCAVSEDTLNRGDLLYLFPKHVCPTVNLQTDVILVDPESDVTAGEPTYQKSNVAARGHEL